MTFRKPLLRLGLLSYAVIAAVLPFLAGTVAHAEATGKFYLKDGDTVVFYGDSITDQRLYTTSVETYVVTRFPRLNVRFFHSGWGGDRVSGGTTSGDIDTRLRRDVYTYKPTVVTVMLGMNDGRYRPFDQDIFDTYKAGMAAIVEKVSRELPGVRLTLIKPSPYDEVTRGLSEKVPSGYNPVLIRFGDAVAQIAKVNGHTVADFNAPLVAMLNKANAADANLAQKIIPDRVHPREAGHLIMAAQLLYAWNAPAIVSKVSIDALAGKLMGSENTEVSNLSLSSYAEALSWTQLDHALPLPVNLSDAETALAIRSSDVMEKLNQQLLMVAGLPGGSYELKIDGERVGDFTAQQMAAGINLAELKTPMAAQATEVHNLTLQHTALHQTRWRTFQVPYSNAREAVKKDLGQVMSALDAADDATVAMQRAAARPVPHRYELRLVSRSTP